MTDRVKESLFGTLASLGYPQEGDRVLDLYAGTGSLGIEALSRGAAWADFVEQNASMALKTAQRAYVLERGAVVLEGPSAQLAEDPRVREAYLGGEVEVSGPASA